MYIETQLVMMLVVGLLMWIAGVFLGELFKTLDGNPIFDAIIRILWFIIGIAFAWVTWESLSYSLYGFPLSALAALLSYAFLRSGLSR